MPRRSTVNALPDDQFEFVIREILNGATDRELSAAFQAQFKKRLPKSSLGRWREATGNELAERYRLARFQARKLLEDMKLEDADKHQVLMQTIEDRLLTATREVIATDPLKLLRISQAEQKRKLQEQRLALEREKVELERERLRGVKVDRVALFTEFAADLLAYIGTDAEGLRWINKHLKKFGEFIQQKHGASES
jgi:hypothetical protein